METLAYFGGTPIRSASIPWVNTMDERERNAVLEVMDDGVLSAFIGRRGQGFLGGKKVQELENLFCEKFQVKHAISVNSATSGLHIAIAACGIGPGDEVLVTPYSMAATASAIVMNNGVPIFVDVCKETYNMNPAEMKKWLTPRTKAVVVTNLFGLPANYEEIFNFAKEHGLFFIVDNAQGPGAKIIGQENFFPDLMVYSLNYHKVIHAGEGGVVVTNEDNLARKCQLLRNHGEVVVDDDNDYETIVLGTNYRMTELHAAIGIEQVKKLEAFLLERMNRGNEVSAGLKVIPGLMGVTVPEGYVHTYYVYPIRFDASQWGFSRELFAALMAAEGFPLGVGYQKPLYLLPMYQHKRVYNETTYPFAFIDPPTQVYEKGICPIVERLYEKELLVADVCRKPFTSGDIADFLQACKKIWDVREEVAQYEKNSSSGT